MLLPADADTPNLGRREALQCLPARRADRLVWGGDGESTCQRSLSPQARKRSTPPCTQLPEGGGSTCQLKRTSIQIAGSCSASPARLLWTP